MSEDTPTPDLRRRAPGGRLRARVAATTTTTAGRGRPPKKKKLMVQRHLRRTLFSELPVLGRPPKPALKREQSELGSGTPLPPPPPPPTPPPGAASVTPEGRGVVIKVEVKTEDTHEVQNHDIEGRVEPGGSQDDDDDDAASETSSEDIGLREPYRGGTNGGGRFMECVLVIR